MKKTKSMTYLIIGLILTGVGIVFTILGTFMQGKEAQEFQSQVISSQTKSIELSEELTRISEEKFHQLTKPEINVFEIKENERININSRFTVIAKNTGNNDCLNAKLIIDNHNSPLAGTFEIQSFGKVPKGAVVNYTIPFFESELTFQSVNMKGYEEAGSNFIKRFNNGELAILVHFHFEYEWNDEILKSSQFSIMKFKGKRLYASSSEDYFEKDE